MREEAVVCLGTRTCAAGIRVDLLIRRAKEELLTDLTLETGSATFALQQPERPKDRDQ